MQALQQRQENDVRTEPIEMLVPHHKIEDMKSPMTTLLGSRVGTRLTTGRGVSSTSASIVVVGATVVIGVIVRTIAVRVVVATSSGGIGSSRSVVVVSLTVSSRSWHGDSVCL